MIKRAFFYLELSLCCFLFISFFAVKAASFSKDASYRVYFTPYDNCTSHITHAIKKAQRSIYVQAYFLTSEPIVSALVTAKVKGVDVNVIVDKGHSENQKSRQRLLESQIPVWIDHASGLAHNKVLIIDEQLVITGSFNFTHAANYRNRENLLLINDKELAKLYLKNWHLCKMGAHQAVLTTQKKRLTPQEALKLLLLAVDVLSKKTLGFRRCTVFL